jgi:hypothetical protein
MFLNRHLQIKFLLMENFLLSTKSNHMTSKRSGISNSIMSKAIDNYFFLSEFQQNVPLIEKKTYLNKYSLPDRCIGGSIFPGTIE